MNPRIRKESVPQGNRNASLRFGVDNKQVMVTKIGTPSRVEATPGVFKKDGICGAGVHGFCVIFQQEIIALVGSHDNLGGEVRLREQEGAQTTHNLRT